MFPSKNSMPEADPKTTDKNEVILNSLREGVCCINADGKIIYANSSASKLLGKNNEQILDKYYSLVFFGKDKEAFAENADFCPINFTISSGETSHVKKDIFVKEDMTDLHVEYMCMALDEESSGAVISFHDTAERYEAEMELSEARDAALEAAQAKAAFLANMSHELRTPLNGIVGTTDLLLESDLNKDQMHYAKMLKASTDLLRHIVNDILDFSKIEAGRIHIENADFDIFQLVNETVNLFAATASEKGLLLDSDIDENVPQYLHTDVNKTKQVLNNLLSNAIKFTSEGEVFLQVSVAGFSDHSVILKFTVSDTGIGIKKENQLKLGQPFEQADASTTRIFGGTGLGLAISKKIVEMLNGTIGFESEIGKGSTFWFTIKAKKVTKDIISEADTVQKNISESNFLNNSMKILVVEDNRINREVTTKMLEQLGLKAEWAENGLQSVNLMAEKDFDLIFMDCQMPVMDGFEATKRIRENPKVKKQPKIIALTASTAIEDSIKCLEVGMDDYLSKPFTKNDLTSVIKNHFDVENLSKNLDLKEDFVQHSISEIIEPSTLESFKEIESNGDDEFTKEILALYANHTEEQMDEIWIAFSKKDLDGIKQRAHNLKGSSANVGLETLRKRFEKLELAIDQKNIKEVEEHVRLAFIEFKETKQLILKL